MLGCFSLTPTAQKSKHGGIEIVTCCRATICRRKCATIGSASIYMCMHAYALLPKNKQAIGAGHFNFLIEACQRVSCLIFLSRNFPPTYDLAADG
jgi:hypothetical protein